MCPIILYSLEGQHPNLAVENVDHVSLLVGDLEPKPLPYGAVPRGPELLVHGVLDQLCSRLFSFGREQTISNKKITLQYVSP